MWQGNEQTTAHVPELGIERRKRKVVAEAFRAALITMAFADSSVIYCGFPAGLNPWLFASPSVMYLPFLVVP
jgi:hypothetical protein